MLLFELFTAGRRNPEIQREVGELFERTRDHVAEILRAKEREGVLILRYDADAVVGFLFALADGIALQVLSDPERDHAEVIAAGTAAARHLLTAELAPRPAGVSDLTPVAVTLTYCLYAILADRPSIAVERSMRSLHGQARRSSSTRRRWLVVGAWLAVVAFSLPLAAPPDRGPERRRLRRSRQRVGGRRGRR